MTVERTIEGWQLRLRSQGFGRYVSGAFLAFWLCGWAVGETIVLWLLIKGAWALLTGTPPDPGREPLEVGPAVMVGVFLLVWLALWTFGGIAAGMELMRLLWGEDRITVAGGGLTVAWVRGPFRTVRHFERDAILRISLIGHADRLSLETARQRVELSGLGSRTERIEGAAGLRAELGIADAPSDAARGLPKEWEEIITPEGERALVPKLATRRIQARVASIATMLLAAVTFVVARESIRRLDLAIGAFILLAFTVGLTAGTLWLARGRWEWRIGSGRLTLRKRYGGTVKDVFEARHLMLDTNTDSDGDPWYELFALADAESLPSPRALQWRPTQPRNSRSVARMMTDASGVRALGAWLSRETGLTLEDRTTLQARQVELAEVRAMLESSGRFGRWVSKLMAPLGEKERRAK